MDFFSTDIIRKDMKSHAEGLTKLYGIEQPEIYIEEQSAENVQLGYSFIHEGERAIFKMPYFRNESGQLAIDENNKVWTLEYRGLTSTGYQTIGDVLETGLNIQRIDK